MADVRRAAREWLVESAVLPGQYLVALSGGGDSLALAWAVSREAPAAGVRVGAVVVDHQLQAGSAAVAQRGADMASGLGLSPVLVKTVTVGSDGGPEEAARLARYEAFREAMEETGATGVLLAHSQDDQAETMVLGLARGSGPSALKGMAPRHDVFHRPFLTLPRATLRAALTDAGIDWWEDPHNSDERYARVRVRNTVLPVLEKELGPGVSESLARTAELFRQDSEALDALARTFFLAHREEHGPGRHSLNVALLLGEPAAIHTRALRMLVASVGGKPPTYAHMGHILTLLHRWKGQSALNLPGATLERRDGTMYASFVA